MTNKLLPGTKLPNISVAQFGGGEIQLARPGAGKVWRVVVVYRGKHCGVCTLYLGELNKLLPELAELNVDLVAVSADTEEKAAIQMELVKPDFPVGYGLTVDQMRELGLYISDPRSAQETDAPFSEPGIFIVDDQGVIQIADIANFPFMRPDLSWLMKGIKFALNPENNYPIRGTKA